MSRRWPPRKPPMSIHHMNDWSVSTLSPSFRARRVARSTPMMTPAPTRTPNGCIVSGPRWRSWTWMYGIKEGAVARLARNAKMRAMDCTIYSEDHELFRKSFRTFLEREVVPNQMKWIEAGIVDREA